MIQFPEKKSPPNNLFAEKIVLGYLFVAPASNVIIFEKLPLEAFYCDINKLIYKTAYYLYFKKKPINIITLSDELLSLNLLDSIGGNEILFQISNQELILEDLEIYISLLVDKYFRRHLYNTCSKINKIIYDQSYSIESVVDNLQKSVSIISQSKPTVGLLPTSELLLETLINLEKNTKQGGLSGTPSGFFDLDALTGGFQKGDLIIIAGRPSMGKTALALNLAKNISENQIFPVAVFSLEMSRQQIIYRLIATESQISSIKLKSGKITSKEWYRINKAISYLAKMRIYIDDNLNNSLSQIKLKLVKLKNKSGNIGAIVIDYLQLLTETSSKETRNQELSKITRNLKIIAKELQSPLIVLSQLSRNLESRYNKRPLLSDLRESGCISGNNKLYSIIHDAFFRIKLLNSLEKKHMFLSKRINSLFLITNYYKKILITGHKNLYKIKIFGEYEVELTPEHKLFTIKGWSKANSLHQDDTVAILDKFNFTKPTIKKISKIIFSDTIFCIIKSIRYRYKSIVYDLWFPSTKNFLCNNIFVHNSIEQDADLVLMLYREEYYGKSKKNIHISELILAKQRNGPTDSIKLVFDPRIVGFSNSIRFH
jgi:replicative DNA helicase